ncbi:hypothetical protein [Methylomicrobium lacus]|uniref:hypothetical protein n=1 Tax=Methylomicrobium lacus TaxID=136992 RepID=UPI00045EA96E|nr:hypothetical protein [Methylomicrobium lacus]
MSTTQIERNLDPYSLGIQRWYKIRQFWNDWNPLGVACEDIQNEYDEFVMSTLKLLEHDYSREDIEVFLIHLVRDYMGLGDEGVRKSNPGAFVQKIMEWNQGNR